MFFMFGVFFFFGMGVNGWLVEYVFDDFFFGVNIYVFGRSNLVIGIFVLVDINKFVFGDVVYELGYFVGMCFDYDFERCIWIDDGYSCVVGICFDFVNIRLDVVYLDFLFGRFEVGR